MVTYTGKKYLFPERKTYSCDEDECQKLQELSAVFSDKKRNTRVDSLPAALRSKPMARSETYTKINSLPKHAQANYRILVYRFWDKDGQLIEGPVDDGEYLEWERTY